MPKIIPERYISSLEYEKKGITLYYDSGMYKLKDGKIIKNGNDGSMSENVYNRILNYHKESDEYVKLDMLITSFMLDTEFFGNVGENFDFLEQLFRTLHVKRYIKKSELYRFDLDVHTNLLYTDMYYYSFDMSVCYKKRVCLGQVLSYNESVYTELIRNVCNKKRKKDD